MVLAFPLFLKNYFMNHIYNDGGRSAAGYKGHTGDCAVRANAIMTGKPYQELYDLFNELGAKERRSKRRRGKSSARTGVHMPTIHRYLVSIGMKWQPTMFIGQGCKVHLRKDELPNGRLIVRLSGHLTSVIDGEIHDTHDPSRNETRCVYGYYTLPE